MCAICIYANIAQALPGSWLFQLVSIINGTQDKLQEVLESLCCLSRHDLLKSFICLVQTERIVVKTDAYYWMEKNKTLHIQAMFSMQITSWVCKAVIVSSVLFCPVAEQALNRLLRPSLHLRLVLAMRQVVGQHGPWLSGGHCPVCRSCCLGHLEMCGRGAEGHMGITTSLHWPLSLEPTFPDCEMLAAAGDREKLRCRVPWLRVLTGGASLCTAEYTSLLS